MKNMKHNLHKLVGKLFPTTTNKESRMINVLSSTLIRVAHSKALLVVALSICCLPIAAQAKAHCFCKLGPPSAPIRDFGEIESYNTQNGHDTHCSNLCNATIDSYMNDSGNHTSACNAAHGTSIVTYSAVGTKAYQAGKTYTCPQTNPVPNPGSIVFTTAPIYSRAVYVNGIGVNPYAPPPFLTVPLQTPFTTFRLDDLVSFHMQQWTYDAILYRDNVLVEQFSKKSPAVSSGGVQAVFTGQPNNSVHGHTWRVQWHYSGSGFTNGSVSFFIP